MLLCSAHGQLACSLFRELVFFARPGNAKDVEKVANASKALLQYGKAVRGKLDPSIEGLVMSYGTDGFDAQLLC